MTLMSYDIYPNQRDMDENFPESTLTINKLLVVKGKKSRTFLLDLLLFPLRPLKWNHGEYSKR